MNRICPLEGTRWRSYFLPLRIGLVLFTVMRVFAHRCCQSDEHRLPSV